LDSRYATRQAHRGHRWIANSSRSFVGPVDCYQTSRDSRAVGSTFPNRPYPLERGTNLGIRAQNAARIRQIAAQQIQQTLQAQDPDSLLGYDLQTFYKPFRDVGGDYFDVIALPHNRTLFAVADVSGKGVPAALLAANIQALVRSIASIDADPLTMARQINSHLSRYTPADRFSTAVFMVLSLGLALPVSVGCASIERILLGFR
jgi:hypothetical protein